MSATVLSFFPKTLTEKSKQARATTPNTKNKTPCALKPTDKLNPETKKTADMARIKEIIFDKFIDSFKITIPKTDKSTGADKIIGYAIDKGKRIIPFTMK